MRGPVVQSLKVRQICFRCSGGRRGRRRAARVRQHDPSESDEIGLPVANGALRRRAAATPAGSCRRSRRRPVPGNRALSRPVARDLPRDAAQRILRRLVAVDGREQRRALDVRVVVRRAGRHADPSAMPESMPITREPPRGRRPSPPASSALASSAERVSIRPHPSASRGSRSPVGARRDTARCRRRTGGRRSSGPAPRRGCPSTISRRKRVRFSSDPP